MTTWYWKLNSYVIDINGGVTMSDYVITAKMEISFCEYLEQDEKSKHTIEKYRRDLRKLIEFTNGGEVTKEQVINFKEYLIRNYALNSVNSILASINRFMIFAGWQDFRVKQLKKQRQVYCPEERELSRQEYFKLIRAAKREGKERIGLIIQTIGSTGIRISELPSITVKAVRDGGVQVDCKGKSRQILMPRKLLMKLMHYIKKEQIKSGPVFVTRQGNPMDRSNIWKEMKKICRKAGVKEKKVFPHNLRHLFACSFYQMEKDIAKLADLLGHSNINTTRIYIVSSGVEHRKQIERLNLLL